MQVHARAEDDVATVFLGLVADSLTYLTNQFSVPGRCQARADGEGSSVERLVSTFALGVDTHTGRTVGQHGGRDAEARNGWRRTGSTGYQGCFAAYHGISAEEVVSTANQQFGFLFQGHGLQHLVDVL